jgi:hypothetical protein
LITLFASGKNRFDCPNFIAGEMREKTAGYGRVSPIMARRDAVI